MLGVVSNVLVAVQDEPRPAPALLPHLPVGHGDPVSVSGRQPGQGQSVVGGDQTGLLVSVVNRRDDSSWTSGQ